MTTTSNSNNTSTSANNNINLPSYSTLYKILLMKI